MKGSKRYSVYLPILRYVPHERLSVFSKHQMNKLMLSYIRLRHKRRYVILYLHAVDFTNCLGDKESSEIKIKLISATNKAYLYIDIRYLGIIHYTNSHILIHTHTVCFKVQIVLANNCFFQCC